ncbi:TetR family transcriptional regulator [Amycolatopsis mediterranei S699]|uniref:TetR family transcriptional regulator n=2 Tax=Amycolatopsis mediterranei TaxID=33910 RepID=A0A0H3DA02_AMYMU|nr:TetR/AcrR family transcriptional regulator [Amycolatopsis mediterranei]ADJ47476.1 TetR family transcriptional regulator [Amycolatopsis mediterranei U32]AEK44326.1 TetR family transcriptional regulator [Amycolatopsis mediterranei S699]AFO79187.1 TetR family transcriptional regulator [Amycolatopsis mediterranei S699]AGT86315.1 TetR family transcriptional regulator [Amycolatopsis mediterranei RB]KDO12598.1 TetR family transcriptional regulator [Amycolatopsis mediterranei]
MTSPAAARGEAVRRRLVAAAVELIPERGWTAVSTRVLAERAGVTPSVVHYHFPSVQAVLVEAVLSAMRAVAGEFEPLVAAVGSAGELVDAMVAAVEQYTGADPTSLLFVEAYLAATRDAGLQAGMAQVLADLRAVISDRLRQLGVARPEDTAAVLAAAVDGLLLHRAIGPQVAPNVAGVLRRLV